MKGFLVVLVALMLALGRAGAQDARSLRPYRPDQAVSGTIRVSGDDQAETVMKYWREGFGRRHPQAAVEARLQGTGSAMAGLYTGMADLTLMGRAATAKEIMAFEWVFRYEPLGLAVMTGSFDVPAKSFALAVFVHQDNPIARLTLAQLDAIFGCERRRGLGGVRTWDQLGLRGEWAGKPMHAYMYDTENAKGVFFQHVVLQDSRKWNWEIIKEFQDIRKPDGSFDESSRQILDALVQDRYGIAISNPRYANSQVKSLVLATQDGGPYYEATKQNLIQRKYPLTREVFVYINRQPGKPVDPKIQEFLRYILSWDGQQDVKREGDFLPLSEQEAREGLEKLK